MSLTKNLLHIVINTKFREMTISEENCSDLYRYITSKVSDSGSKMLRINGIGNHIHMLIDLNPNVALSALMKDIKQSTSIWMKRSGKFPLFGRWGAEYFAMSISESHKDAVIKYIAEQKSHHQVVQFDSELMRLVDKSGSEWHDYYLS